MEQRSTKLVILHGWGQSSEFWQLAQEKLSVNMHAIDLPGFGARELISTEWGIPEYADWVSSYLRQEEISNAVILGHSFGGRIAAYMAANDIYQPKALILYGAPLLYRPSSEVRRKIFINKLLKKVVPKSIRSRFINNQELKEADEKGLGRIFRNVVTFDQTKFLSKIKSRTLLLWGENDEDVPLRIAEEAVQLIPNAELEILPDLGHNAHLENPNLFYGKVKKFIETID